MSQRTNYIFRVVGRGAKAEGVSDDDETDLDGPCDLVLLVETTGGREKEIDRKEFDKGTEASSYLLGLVQRPKEEGETS